MESIVSFRQWQLHLPSNTLETKLTLWMHVSFQEIQSLLPIYFDRVHAFATPFYGFDTDALWQRQESTTSSSAPHNYHHPHNRTDSNVTITDFLRRQEKLGGPPTAVAVVLDAVATSNLHVERGFRLASAEAEFKNEEDARVLWPAVYLRSTLHLASSLSSSANTRHSPHSSGVFRSSHNSLLSGWSHGANNTLATNIMTAGNSPSGKADRKQSILSSSPASSQRNISVYQHHQSMLEYAPDTGQAMSWPHNDWESLVASLDKNADAQKALSSDTQHNRFEDKSAFDEDEAGAVATVVDEGTSLFPELPVPVTKPTIDGFRKKHGRYSTFHTVALSEWLNLVVMVKDEEEESRWHRRRNRLDDEEVHSFVSDVLAKKLCVSSIFSAESVISLRKKVKHEPSLSLPYNFAVTWANEKQVQDFLGDVKEFFGLRPVSPLAKDSTRSYNFYSTGNTSPRTPASRRSVILRSGLKYRLRQSLKTVPFDDSAAILFLGPDLASLLD